MRQVERCEIVTPRELVELILRHKRINDRQRWYLNATSLADAHHLGNFQLQAAPRITRSHLINARTSLKGRHLQDETVETQPNHHFPPDSITAGLWFCCHKTIYEITSSSLKSTKRNHRAERKREIEPLSGAAASCRYGTRPCRPILGTGGWAAVNPMGRTGIHFAQGTARGFPHSRNS